MNKRFMMTTGVACAASVLLVSTASGQIAELPPGLYQAGVSPDLVATVRATLPEARAVGVEFLDPQYDPVVRLSEPASVTVRFVDEGAGYRNSLAWLAFPAGAFDLTSKADFDADGSGNVSLTELVSALEAANQPGTVFHGLVFPNVSRTGAGGQLNPGDAVDLGGGQEFPAGTVIVFCLLQNAWKNGQVEGYTTALETTTSVYTVDMINPESPGGANAESDSEADRSRHVAMLFADAEHDEIIMGFEDLHRTDRNQNDFRIGSDEDFNDAVFIVSSTPAEAIRDTDIPGADPAFNPVPQGLFYDPDCCDVDTTSILEDELPERTNVNAAFLDPAYTPTVVVSEATQLQLSFIGEGAIYQNSLGYITYTAGALDDVSRASADTDGDGVVEPWELRSIEGVELGMVFAHASVAGGAGSLEPNDAVVLGDDREFAAGARVDFFLVQDGWNDNGTVKDFLRDTGETTLTFYTIDKFNPEDDAADRRHVAMLFANEERDDVLLGFEDLHRRDRERNPARFESDEDFNDNVFCVAAYSPGALATTRIPVAGDGCVSDLNGDRDVDFRDLYEWVDHFAAESDRGDLDGDGVVDGRDLESLARDLLAGCGR